MAKDMDLLLKVDKKENVSSNIPNEDILRSSKRKIKGICRAFSSPPQNYKPEKTIKSIKQYLQDKTTRERILYSEFSSYVFGMESVEQGNFATNIETLLAYCLDDGNSVEEDHYKIIIKIFDHFQLAVQQKTLNSNTKEIIHNKLIESMDDAQKAITENVKKDVKHIEREYITILGVFAAIVLAFVGGITFSTSVLQNINAISIYRLLLVAVFLTIMFVNLIYVLVKFICKINDKDMDFFKIKLFNIFFCVISVLIIVAWTLDAGAFADLLRQYLPWIK